MRLHLYHAQREVSAIPLSGSSPPLLPITTLFRVDLSLVRPVGRVLRGRDASRRNRFSGALSRLNVSTVQFHPRTNFRDERPIIAAVR